MLMEVAAVATGAAGGALLRWQLTKASSEHGLSSLATAGINTAGSFILGVTFQSFHALDNKSISARQMLLIGTGFCGSFTTFSTFSVDVVNLLQKEMYGRALSLVAGTNVLGISVSNVFALYL